MKDFTSLVSLRYLKISRRDMFFTWISVLSIVGIAIGVAAMIVVLSVINGFEEELRKRFLAANAHVLAYHFPTGITNYHGWIAKIARDFKDEVKGLSPFVHYETMARTDSSVHFILVRGIHPRQRAKVQSLDGLIAPADALDLLQKEIDDREPPREAQIIVGKGLLRVLDGRVGGKIRLISPQTQSLSQYHEFRVVGVYNSGLKHYDNRVGIVSLRTAQQFFGMGNRVTGVEIGLHAPEDSRPLAARMRASYNLSIKEWQSFNRPLFEAMKQERAVISVIVALVALVAIFNIFTTLFVSVSQKLRDISILKSIGATNSQINTIFLKQGCLIGLFGCFFGVVVALLASSFLRRYRIIDLPDIYLLSELPVRFDIWVYLGVCCTSIICCLIAGLYPAWVATHTSPLEIMRNRNQYD